MSPAAGLRIRVAATIAALAVLASPARTHHDSFPVSTYPMYATVRSGETEIITAIGLTAAGPVRLSMGVIADADDPLIVQSTLRDAVRTGQVAELCAGIAARVDAGTITDISIVTEVVDLGRSAAEPSPPRSVHHTCAVPS